MTYLVMALKNLKLHSSNKIWITVEASGESFYGLSRHCNHKPFNFMLIRLIESIEDFSSKREVK